MSPIEDKEDPDPEEGMSNDDEEVVQAEEEVHGQDADGDDDGTGEADEEESEEWTDEEFLALDRQLDQLNAALDVIERKNDDIHSQLKEILESNRRERLPQQEPD